MRPLPALAIALALSSGCTAIKATYHVSTADTAVAEAVKFGAPERATYEYTMATRYLEESKEKLGFSQYRSSERLAKKSYEWADKAIISVENRRKVEGEVGFEDQPTPASPPPPPPAPVVAPAPPATSAWGAPAPVAAPAPASAWGAPAPVAAPAPASAWGAPAAVPASPGPAVVWGAPVPAPAPAAPTAVVIPVAPAPVVEVDMWGIPIVRPGTAPPAPAPAPPPPKPKDDFGNLEQDGE